LCHDVVFLGNIEGRFTKGNVKKIAYPAVAEQEETYRYKGDAREHCDVCDGKDSAANQSSR
jgi:hypothetical protein